jgi:hypothetical protein
MNEIHTRLLELYLEELRKRDSLTGSDRITLYKQFREVLENEEKTEDKPVSEDNSPSRARPYLEIQYDQR